MHTESFRNEMRRRRPRRYSVVTTLASRGASALQAWLWLLVFIFQNEFRISDSIQPGYLDFDNLPDTNFTCAGKVIGGYYADLETSCQMFHVCTVGQADEPMDIKFLCLNGTVFDQETRVCERVDEVDCTKSEKFYSLNLELYGSTVAPVVEHERDKSHEQSHEQSHDRKPVQTTSSTPTTTAPPVPSSDPPRHHLDHNNHQTEHVEPAEENQEPEEEEEDLEDEEYEDYTPTPAHTTTSFQPATTGVPFTTQPPTTPPTPTTSAPLPTYGVPSDPSLLSPHEFTYQHTRPAASPAAAPAVPPPALSFQRQSYPQHAQPPRLTLTAHRTAAPPPASTLPPNPPPRPADHVYITAEPHHYSEIEQIDHYELYESSKNAPRRPHDRPAPFLPSHVSRTPQGFRPPPTATPPRSQLQSPGQYDSRPVQSYQPSERHEILYEDRYRQPPLPAPTYDYDRFHYDRKRSHETEPSTEDELPIARSVSSTSPVPAVSSTREPPTQRPTLKVVPKSPPRVIVTASASVSDSNGKKLNYTVGNVVRAVKPIVPINYDDYKESDLIFDPFFLDVPKLSRRRKTSGSTGHDLGKRNVVITLQQVAAAPLASPPSQVVTKVTTTAPGWLPPDYVDDNYEPNAYVELPQYEKQNHSLPEENDLKKKVLKTVVSSQSPAVASATTTATAKLGGGDGADPEKGMWRLSARWPAVMRPLLAALPPPGGGDFKVVSAGSAASSKSSFSCEGRKLYELFADAKDCGAFHVCAESGLHVRLRCARGLRYRASARACARPARGEPACDDPLGDV